MKPVKAVDAAFLQLETAATPMHVGALFVLEPRSARERATFFRRFRAEIGARLGRSEVFTRRVASLPFNVANPIWVVGQVDLDYHVRRTTLPEPGNQHQLEECVADLHAPLMDRSRPLWELHVIEGLEGGRLALYVKTHHAGLDGASAQLYLKSFVDTNPHPDRKDRRGAKPPASEHPATVDLVSAGARHQFAELLRLPRAVAAATGGAADAIRSVRQAVTSLAAGVRSAPRTPLNVAITGERSFASVECSLGEAKSIARTHDATVNDVILAACAGALRRWFILHDSLPDAPLVSSVPFSTRDSGNTDHSIQVSFMSVTLHTDIDDPHARLRAIHESAAQSKVGAERTRAMMPDDLPSIGLPWLLGGLARLMTRQELIGRLPLPTNVIISNVAGPPVPLYVAGAKALTYSPVSIPYHGCALNITVYSYDGRLFFGLTGARSALPDLRDLAEGVQLELRLLGQRPAAKRSGKARPAHRAAAHRSKRRT
jgi:diacylglycerol O-acyltransferase / wax synthase